LKVSPERLKMTELLAAYAPIRSNHPDLGTLPAQLAGLPAELQRTWQSGLDDLTLADLVRPPAAPQQPAATSADELRLDR